jgi:hypothetical protein
VSQLFSAFIKLENLVDACKHILSALKIEKSDSTAKKTGYLDNE